MGRWGQGTLAALPYSSAMTSWWEDLQGPESGERLPTTVGLSLCPGAAGQPPTADGWSPGTKEGWGWFLKGTSGRAVVAAGG